MKNVVFALLLAVFLLPSSFASARSRRPAHAPSQHLQMPCAWSPHHPEVCAARASCAGNPATPQCAVYCEVNPRDVICGEVYQKPLRPTAPYYNDSPYPWARSGGGFCNINPGNIACQNDTFGWPNY